MKKFELLEDIANANNGIIKISDAVRAGISKTYVLEFVKREGYEKIAGGIYLSPYSWEDGMCILQMRYKEAVFSHETALYLLSLVDREPLQYTVTLKRGYNPKNLAIQGIKAYTVKKEWYEMGVTEAETPMGHIVKVYNAERTLCDIFRGHSQVEIQDRQTAIKEYMRQRGKDIPKLMEYAHIFKVNQIIKPYLEVLA